MIFERLSVAFLVFDLKLPQLSSRHFNLPFHYFRHFLSLLTLNYPYHPAFIHLLILLLKTGHRIVQSLRQLHCLGLKPHALHLDPQYFCRHLLLEHFRPRLQPLPLPQEAFILRHSYLSHPQIVNLRRLIPDLQQHHQARPVLRTLPERPPLLLQEQHRLQDLVHLDLLPLLPPLPQLH